MRKVALITAAGFHGVSTQFPGLGNLPEALLPLKDGSTPLSRLSHQFADQGFEVFAAVGRVGCLFPMRMAYHAKHWKYSLPPGAIEISPWTQERIDEVSEYAIPIIMPEPDEVLAWDSIRKSLDAIGYDWEQMIVMYADHLISNRLLKGIMGLPFPCQFGASHKRPFLVHCWNPEVARLCYKLIEPWCGFGASWIGGLWKRGKGVPAAHKYVAACPMKTTAEAFPEFDDMELSNDIDNPKRYRATEQWLDQFGDL